MQIMWIGNCVIKKSERRAMMIEVVDNQLKMNNPPETRKTLDRLNKEGYSEEEAKELIACAVVSEMYDILKSNKPFNLQRYVACLDRLPQLPED